MPEPTAAEKKEARREAVHSAVDRIPFSSSGSRRWKFDEPRRMKVGTTGIATFDLPYRSREEKEYLKGSDPVTAYMDTKFERDRDGITSRFYKGAGVITKDGKKVELVRGGDKQESKGFTYMGEALEHKMKVRYQGYKGPEKRRMRGTRKRNTYPSHSHRNNTAHGVITRKADLKRDEQYTIWLKMPSGGYVIERSYPGGYIKDAMWNDIKAFNKANTRQYAVVGHGIDPNDAGYYRKNDMVKSSVINRMKAEGWGDPRFGLEGGDLSRVSFKRKDGRRPTEMVVFRNDFYAGGWSVTRESLTGQGKVISSDLLKCGMPSLGNAVLWFTKQSSRSNPPVRKNFVGSLVRGGVALAKTKMGKAIIAETAVVAAVMIGDKLVSKGKISPKVMTYVQGRVEQKTGVKPSKAEVTKVLSAMDKNKDKTLTDAEVIEALELIQKGKKK